MFRVLFVGLLLLAVPAIVMAQDNKAEGTGGAAAAPAASPFNSGEVFVESMPMWQRFVVVFALALLVIIVVQLMMLRSDINTMIDRVGSATGMPVKR